MKTIILIIALTVFGTVDSSGQTNEVQKLLKNQDSRTQIFNTILNNQKLFSDFLKTANEKGQPFTMMNGYNNMMGRGMMGMNNYGRMNRGITPADSIYSTTHYGMMGWNRMMGSGNSTGRMNYRGMMQMMMGNMMNDLTGQEIQTCYNLIREHHSTAVTKDQESQNNNSASHYQHK